jgi:hypothetical protein
MKKKGTKSGTKNVPSSAEPTPYELVKLAAALKQKSSTGYHPQEFWVKEALALWLTAHGVLEKWRANPAEMFPEPVPESPPEPEPKKYPVTLNKFLQIVLPKFSGRTGDLFGTFREYLTFRLNNPTSPNQTWAHGSVPPNAIQFDCLNPRIVPAIQDDFALYSLQSPKPAKLEPTKENVDHYFALWNAQGVPDLNSFFYHKHWFCKWYQEMHAADLKAKRRAAGAKGLGSPKRPKKVKR